MRPNRTMTPEEHIRKAQELMVLAAERDLAIAPQIHAEVSAHASLATALYAQQAAGTARGRRRPPPEPYGALVGPDITR